MITHTVPSDTFDQLAGGDGDMLGVLRAGQRSKRMLLLRELHDAARSSVPRLYDTAGTAAAFAVLTQAQRRSAEQVDEFLLYPHVGAWVARALGALVSRGDISPEDLGHLGGVAAVAAHIAGQSFDVTAVVREGLVMFPSLGSVQLPTPRGWCRIRSEDGDTVEIEAAGATTVVSLSTSLDGQPGWIPLRRLTSTAQGLRIDVALDDLDPFRGCGHLPISERIDPPTVGAWQVHLDQAWSLLVEDHRPRAHAISSYLSTVVPLRPTAERSELSASCHEAVGAMSMTPPANPLTQALALVHEFQHNKLSALLDLVPLLRSSRAKEAYSPWRTEPRPWRGLLQGAYAYLALAELWNARRFRATSPGEQGGDLAHFEFALARDQVRRGLRDLQASDQLTGPGQRFVTGMGRRLADFEELTVPAHPHALAHIACLDHEISWRLRNSRPDPGQVDAWADAWLAGRPCPAEAVETSIIDGDGPMPGNARFDLIRERLARQPAQEDDSGVTRADLLLVDGHPAEAAEMYLAQLRGRSDDAASWAGLALARRLGPSGVCEALSEVPEMAIALDRAIRDRAGIGPDVDELLTWLAESR